MESGRKLVLIVDDEYDSISPLVEGLSQQGCDVTVVADGQEALDYLDRGRIPDLFIVDLMMPRVMGGDVILLLRDDPELRHKPVIVVTGHSPAPEARLGRHIVLAQPCAICGERRTCARAEGLGRALQK